MTTTDIAAIFVAVAVPLVAWVFSRITKARQGETHEQITAATEAMRTEVIDHMDQRLESTDQRIEELAKSVQWVDEQGRANAQEIAYLQGKLGVHPRRATEPPTVQ